jgi:hypothetical protein
MKDQLKWKLGLRNTSEVNIGKLGLKSLNLGRNILGKKTAILIAHILKSDEYMRAISLRKNRIGEEGVRELFAACKANNKLLMMDLIGNPGFEKSEHCKLITYQMLFNTRRAIKNYHKNHHRINYEWINPESLGINIITQVDNPNISKKAQKKAAFIQVAS